MSIECLKKVERIYVDPHIFPEWTKEIEITLCEEKTTELNNLLEIAKERNAFKENTKMVLLFGLWIFKTNDYLSKIALVICDDTIIPCSDDSEELRIVYARSVDDFNKIPRLMGMENQFILYHSGKVELITSDYTDEENPELQYVNLTCRRIDYELKSIMKMFGVKKRTVIRSPIKKKICRLCKKDKKKLKGKASSSSSN
nr:TPA_asm: 22 kDa protein [Xerochrysum ophiovirus_macra]